jgi:phage terminase large subunit
MDQKLQLKWKLKQLLDEANRRKNSKLEIIDPSFVKQAAFVADTNPFVAGFCTRRAGKSMGVGKRLFRAAKKHRGSSVLYIAKTKESARKIMWKDVINPIVKRYGINADLREHKLEVRLPDWDGSTVYLTGSDASDDELDKILGQKFSEVVIDEAAHHRRNLRTMVYDILKPAVADYEGSITLIGTPSNVASGLFYDITKGKEPGWSMHQWSALDNPYMKDKWNAQIADLKRRNPAIIETPGFKQMYLGEWAVDDSKLCIKYSRERNWIPHLPRDKGDQWYYLLGVDLGFDPDPSAFVVFAYRRFDRNLYILETHKQNKMIFSDVAERIKYYQKNYKNLTVVIDAANKQGVEEMKKRHTLPLIYAEKTDKATFMDLMNSDMIGGFIKFVGDAGQDLIEEWSKLVWDEESEKRIENANCANHLSDAALYGWRWCYNYAAEIRPTQPNIYSEEYIEEQMEQSLKKNMDPDFIDYEVDL